MSILIKGVEMPTNCRACMFSRTDIRNVDWCVLTEKDLPCDCPIVHVPEHGRLIDADALEMERRAENAKKGWHDSFAVIFIGDPYYEAAYDCTEQLKELVNNAPTIIQADPAKGEE